MTTTAHISKYLHDAAVVIGRFEPPHNAHFSLFEKALSTAETVNVVLGSAFQARSPKNPFTADERKAMILSGIREEDRLRMRFIPVRDYYDESIWADEVSLRVEGGLKDKQRRPSVVLVGHMKDDSSYYLSLFETWEKILIDKAFDIDATVIRKVLFEAEDIDISLSVIDSMVPAPVRQYLRAWSFTPYYTTMKADHKATVEWQKKWDGGPRKQNFLAADSVVETQGRVLLIRRGKAPGKGLLALPGGFVEPNERVLTAALRELAEETMLGMPIDAVRRSLVGAYTFDASGRSPRGRIYTTAYHFNLKTSRYPEVEASDDALKGSANWFAIDKLHLLEGEFFEDHFHILNRVFKIIKEQAA